MGRRQRRLAKTLSPEQFAAELLRVNFIYNAVTVRRHVLERAGGYDPNMVYSEDYELWLRFTALGFSAVRVPGPLAVKRDRPDSLTANEAEMIAGTLTAYTAALQRHPVVPYFGELAKARLDQIRAAERRQSTAKARIVALPRNALAAATRPWRRRWALRSAPPPDVARAFPGLGVCRGRRTLRAGAR